MKKTTLKILSLYLCAAILAACFGTAAFAENQSGVKEELKNAVADLAKSDDKNDGSTEKDETVYVIAGADGSVQKVIVSDWIKNVPTTGKLKDLSELTDIENLKGDEGYTLDGDNVKVWDAQGKDIYYQGNIKKDIPVTMNIRYTLDGKAIDPKELAGKSGKVTMRFEYKNNLFEEVTVDGKKEKIYVPFAMLTGMILDNDVFSNVRVSNGKMINDGSRTAVIGIALPGLAESLGIDSAAVDLPNYVEISANVKNFELASTMTVASNEIFNKLDPDSLESIDSVTGSLGKLTDAMNEMLNGSGKLYEGLCTLSEKSGQLINGIDKLAKGAKDLKSGADALYNGAGELKSGSAALAGGLNKLDKNSAALNAGAKKVFNTLLKEANTQLKAAGVSADKLTIQNYSKVLKGIIDSLDKDKVYDKAYAVALDKVSKAVNAQKDKIESEVTKAVRAGVEKQVSDSVNQSIRAQVLAQAGLTEETYAQAPEEVKAQVDATVSAMIKSSEVEAKKEALVEENMKSAKISEKIKAETENQINALIKKNMNSKEVQDQINAALKKAQSGAASISELKSQLDSYNEFYTGLLAYTGGVSTAANGANSLKNGTVELYTGAGKLSEGADALYNGIGELKDGSSALVDGVNQLRDGAQKLSGGIEEFNRKGIQKLVQAVDGNVGKLTSRLRAISEVSNRYNTFSGLIEGMNGRVRFVYRTESVKAGE